MLKPLPPSLREDVAAATGGSKSSNYAVNLDYTLSITLIFIVSNRGLQGIASVLLPPAAQRGCPPSKREARAAFAVDRALFLADIMFTIACKDAKKLPPYRVDFYLKSRRPRSFCISQIQRSGSSALLLSSVKEAGLLGPA